MMYIEIEDLIGNAFIPYLEETGDRILSMRKIEKFATKVLKDLEKKGIRTYYRTNRDLANEFFYNYSEMFKKVENGEDVLVVLNNEVTVEELITKFSGYLSIEVLLSFRNKENIKVLF